MKQRTPRRRDIFKRLNTHYRLVFIDDESLIEVASFRLTMRKLYILFSTIFVVLVVLTVTVLLLTPLKYYIPGYGNDNTRVKVMQLKRQVDSLSDLSQQQQKYEENLRTIIAGEKPVKQDTTMLDMSRVNQEAMKSMLPSADVIKKDAIEAVKRENKQQTNGRKNK